MKRTSKLFVTCSDNEWPAIQEPKSSNDERRRIGTRRWKTNECVEGMNGECSWMEGYMCIPAHLPCKRAFKVAGSDGQNGIVKNRRTDDDRGSQSGRGWPGASASRCLQEGKEQCGQPIPFVDWKWSNHQGRECTKKIDIDVSRRHH